jgi:hypothetical protein
MRRPFLVFAVLVPSAVASTLVSTPLARASVACVCATDVAVLPAPGAREVPRNAKIWVVGGMLGPSRLDGGDRVWTGNGRMVAADDARATQQFDPGALAPGRSYRFRGLDFGPATRFTTGGSDDTAPPVRPAVRALWIAVRDHGAGLPVAELGFDAALDPDAALLHFVLTSERTRLSLVTTTTSWRELGRPACGTALPFAAGERVRVAVSAIDLAGNESLPAIRDIEVGRAASTLAGCVRHNHDDCLAMNPFMLFGGSVLTLIGVFGVLGCLAMHLRRVREARFAVAEPVSLLVVERLARAVQRRGGVLAAVGIVGVPALVVMHVGPAAIISTIVGCIGLRAFFIARGALQLIEEAAAPGGEGEPGATRAPATAEVVAHTLIIRRGEEETRLDVSPTALAAALRHAVPMSIATRR